MSTLARVMCSPLPLSEAAGLYYYCFVSNISRITVHICHNLLISSLSARPRRVNCVSDGYEESVG